MKKKDVSKIDFNAVDLWMNRWLLLTVGTMKHCNMMTVAWGSIGCMWSKPFVQIAVRPQRYTWGFITSSDSFTLCAFSETYRKDLKILGTVSGRDCDKLSKTSLTLRPSETVDAPSYNEASLVLECRKMYVQDIDPNGFLYPEIDANYQENDYHTICFGEITAAFTAE